MKLEHWLLIVFAFIIGWLLHIPLPQSRYYQQGTQAPSTSEQADGQSIQTSNTNENAETSEGDNQERKNVPSIDVISNILIVVFTGLLAFTAWRQTSLMNRQSNAMDKQTDYMESGLALTRQSNDATIAAADASRMSADIADTSLRISERPYIFLYRVALLTTQFVKGNRIVINAQFTNSGRQATTDLVIRIGFRYVRRGFRNEISTADMSSAPPQSELTIFPNANLDIPLSRIELIGGIPGEDDPRDPTTDSSWKLYVFGQITYTLPLEKDRTVTSYFAANCLAWEERTYPGTRPFTIHNFDPEYLRRAGKDAIVFPK